ncbi:hypothetical protein LV83_01868 [Algoriphagus yeomjeoni]|uniref:Uncharacterized protein n=1 Tax=Algoriphagus yeomjeoni TaxID=291403 RepID=A0A327PJJ2_9BACT|nr:hypothetical protein LV83_01868 [Algoriphagus yeomjeoni]
MEKGIAKKIEFSVFGIKKSQIKVCDFFCSAPFLSSRTVLYQPLSFATVRVLTNGFLATAVLLLQKLDLSLPVPSRFHLAGIYFLIPNKRCCASAGSLVDFIPVLKHRATEDLSGARLQSCPTTGGLVPRIMQSSDCLSCSVKHRSSGIQLFLVSILLAFCSRLQYDDGAPALGRWLIFIPVLKHRASEDLCLRKFFRFQTLSSCRRSCRHERFSSNRCPLPPFVSSRTVSQQPLSCFSRSWIQVK